MKKLTFLLVFLCIVLFNEAKSQYCGAATSNVAITPTATAQLTPSYNTGRRAFNFVATAGCTYQFETCGYSTADTYLRLYSMATGGTLLASSDDNCGAQSRIIWTCTASGTYSIFLTNYLCSNLTVTTRMRYIVNSCGAASFDPCSSISTISNCGVATNFTVSAGNGAYNPPLTSCGFSTPGQEKIFTFTPSATAVYTIAQTSSFGWVDWFFKPVSGGCNGNGWTCIDDLSGATTSVGFSLTAGVQYYIMADPESTIGGNVAFNISCPVLAPINDLVCNALSISCGSSVSGTTIGSTNSGTGEGGACGTSQTMPGVWYTVTGNGDQMTASLCATAWDSKISVFSGNCSTLTCVGGNDDSGPVCATTAASYSWVSNPGTVYYILVHGYSLNNTFSLNLSCVPPPTPGPCNNSTPYGVANFPTTSQPFEIITCSYAGEYSQWSVPEIGVTYIASSTDAGDWLTVRQGTPNGSVIAYGNTPLSFTVPTVNTYYVHVNANNICATETACRNIQMDRISALPVEMIFFRGNAQLLFNFIEWSTASEYNSDYFKIENSADGHNWVEIGYETAAGWSTQQISYDYLHYNVQNAVNYYRLLQFDKDGVYEVYGPIAIDNRKETKRIVKYINTIGQEVPPDTQGVIIVVYEDGSMIKTIK